MSPEEVSRAIQAGMDLAAECARQGYQILATGEMGIGNTTTSSAVLAALLKLPAESVTGRGAGLSDEGLLKKKRVIKDALERYQLHDAQPLRILQCVGGLDIAGLTGVFLGGAMNRIPVVIDGCISAVAALLAERLCPGCRRFMLASHLSREPVAAAALSQLSLRPVIDADMALGEGTGAVLLFPLLDMALAIYNSCGTFAACKIEEYHEFTEET